MINWVHLLNLQMGHQVFELMVYFPSSFDVKTLIHEASQLVKHNTKMLNFK